MVVMVVLVVLVVVGGEVRLGNLVNQGLSSARQAAILASECSQPARGSAASDESVQVRQIKVTLLSLATLHILAQQPWPLATSPCSRQNLHPPLPSPSSLTRRSNKTRAMPAAPRFPFEIIAAMYGPKQ